MSFSKFEAFQRPYSNRVNFAPLAFTRLRSGVEQCGEIRTRSLLCWQSSGTREGQMSAKAYGAPLATLAMMCFSLIAILPYSGPVGCDHLVGASPATGL